MIGAGVAHVIVGVVLVTVVDAPSWATVRVRPPIVMEPVRPNWEVLGCTWKGTDPLPVPLFTHSVSQAMLVEAVHEHVEPVATCAE
jgi:hypothetical protein